MTTDGLGGSARDALWRSLDAALARQSAPRPDVAEVWGHSLEGTRREWDALTDGERTTRGLAFPAELSRYAEARDADLAVNGIPLPRWLGIVAEGGFGAFERLHVRVRPRSERDRRVVGLEVPHLLDLCDRTDGVGFYLALDAGALETSPIREEVAALKAAHAALRERLASLLPGGAPEAWGTRGEAGRLTHPIP